MHVCEVRGRKLEEEEEKKNVGSRNESALVQDGVGSDRGAEWWCVCQDAVWKGDGGCWMLDVGCALSLSVLACLLQEEGQIELL